MPATPITDADLRWQYRITGWASRGISFEDALQSPELLAALRLGASRRLRRTARAQAKNQGAGIERSHPDHSSTNP